MSGKHAERVAARTSVDATRGNEGRTRYHGQERRGMPSLIDRDLADAKLARKSIERAIVSLEKAADATLTPFTRDEHHRIGLGQLGLAGRAIDEVVVARSHADLFRRRGSAT